MGTDANALRCTAINKPTKKRRGKWERDGISFSLKESS